MSVECSFAQVRVIHSSQRGKQGHLAFRNEMFCKFNFWCLEEILIKTINKTNSYINSWNYNRSDMITSITVKRVHELTQK